MADSNSLLLNPSKEGEKLYGEKISSLHMLILLILIKKNLFEFNNILNNYYLDLQKKAKGRSSNLNI